MAPAGAFGSWNQQPSAPHLSTNKRTPSLARPQAKLLGANRLQLLQQWRRPFNKPVRGIGGRVLRIQYTATVPETGLSCTGVAEVCAARMSWPKKRNGTPPKCASFSSTKRVANALDCSPVVTTGVAAVDDDYE